MILFFIAFVQAVYGQKPLVVARIKSVSISKSPCFGFCPVYTLRIDKKGKAYLEAKQNVSKDLKGNYITSLNHETQQKLADILQQAAQTTTKDTYGDHNVTDLPATDIVIRYCKKKTKNIHDYGNKGTSTLEELYALIAEIVSNANWKPVKRE